MELDRKMALVTGAGHGIGKAIALALAAVGADVKGCRDRFASVTLTYVVDAPHRARSRSRP